MIRVLIADDERLIRAGYRMILNSEPDIEVVGEAADGVEAVEMVRSLHPDVVLMDVRMPNLDGIAATRALGAVAHRPAVLVVTTFDLDEYVFEALRAGAGGFLLKDAPETQLLAAIRSASEGIASFTSSVTRRLVETFAHPHQPAQTEPGGGLTEREIEILTHVALGLSNAEIATALGIGQSTVKTHVSRVLAKLGLTSRTQAVIAAYEWGLVRAGRPP